MSKIKVGIFGAGRGMDIARNFLLLNADIVAICDKDERKIKTAKKKLGDDVPAFTDFDEFIKTPMDCVFLANYFHEHTKYAIKCLEMGIHVLSECTSNSTMAEGVALCRAAEKSKAMYMLAENYPYMLFNQEMKRVFDGGSLGKLMFAEGEYNHPFNPYLSEKPGLKYIISLREFDEHWRNYLPATYYVTHSLAPLMHATGAKPTRVTAMPIFMPNPTDSDATKRVGDKTAVMMTQNDDGSVFRITGCASFGAHDNSYRLCCTKGQIENVRGGNGKVMLRYNDWEKPEDKEETNYYLPELCDKDKELIEKAGHGGGDFFVIREFFRCIREGVQHPFDVYFATRMASVAILGHKSLLAGGMPYDIPDFRLEEDKKKWENDNSTPFYYSEEYDEKLTSPNIPLSSKPDYKPSQKQLDNFAKWLERYDNGELDNL